jgi:hypothetical protein
MSTTVKVLEKDIEKKIVAYAKSKGCIVRKFTSPAQRAVPDRIIVTPRGVVGFLEVKRPGNKPTPLQYREMELLGDNNAKVEWHDNVEEAKRFIDDLLELRLVRDIEEEEI